MRRPPVPLLLCLALVCGLLSACGDGDERPARAASEGSAPRTQAANTVLASTFGERGHAASSGRVELSLRVRGRGIGGLRGPLSVRMTGPFDFTGRGAQPRFDVDTVTDAAGRRTRSGAVSTGRAGFVRSGGRTYQLPPELYTEVRTALSGPDANGGAPSFRSLGIDPRRWLLDARRGPVEDAGGSPAIHVTGALNVPRMLDDLDTMLGQAGHIGMLLPGHALSGLGQAERHRIADAVRHSSVDIWTGEKDRVLRRLDVGIDLEDGGGLQLRLRVLDVGEPQAIRAPRDARPFAELLSDGFGALLRSLGESDGGEDALAGTATRALRCLRSADADPEALRRCALKLVGRPSTRGDP